MPSASSGATASAWSSAPASVSGGGRSVLRLSGARAEEERQDEPECRAHAGAPSGPVAVPVRSPVGIDLGVELAVEVGVHLAAPRERRRGLARADPGVDGREHEEREDRARHQPADDDGREWSLDLRARAAAEQHRHEPDGRERGRGHDGAEPLVGAREHGLATWQAVNLELADGAHHHEPVQDRDAEEGNEADARRDRERQAQQVEHRHPAHDRHRDAEVDDRRQAHRPERLE